MGMLLIAAMAASLTQATVPPATAAGEPTDVEGVTVESRGRVLDQLVRRMTAPTPKGRLGRWNGRICPGIVGLAQKDGGYIADRIALEAQTLGLDVGEPGCAPNILILFTNAPDKAAADLKAKYGRTLMADRPRSGDVASGGGGRQSVADFLVSDQPVRWWHLSETVPSDGRTYGGMELPTALGQKAGGPVVPLIESPVSSRLASLRREDFGSVIVIVDNSQLKGVTYEALASYLAMVTLAQLEPDSDAGSMPSILNLFRDRDAGLQPPDTITEWDRAFLSGLYAAPADARGLSAQHGAIRRSLERVGGP